MIGSASGLHRGALTAAALLAFLIVFGGGGSPAPLAELVCELAAALALGICLIRGGTARSRPAGLVAVVLLMVVPPLAQLVPLPAAIWQGLPGRENLVATLALTGTRDGWWPISIAPHRTLAALLSLGPPLVVLWITACTSRREHTALLAVVAAMALLAVIVGAGQLAQGSGGSLDFYGTRDQGVLHGFQANRNTAADVLLVGVLALTAVWTGQRRRGSLVWDAAFASGGLLLLLGVFLTASRTGIALIPAVLGLVWAMARRPHPDRRAWTLRPWQVFGGGAAAVSGLAALWWWRATPAIAKVLARFDFAGEFRPELWRDAWYATALYWPVGTGLGTFAPAFNPAERLEVVDPLLANRAHNELLELAIEGGIPLLGCWLAIAAILAIKFRAALAPDSALPRAYVLFAGGVLAITGIHSLVDYPLRSVAMAALAALAAGIILASGAHDFSAKKGSMEPR